MDEPRLARVLAYVDGELAPAERSAFEQEMTADPGLAAEVARHRALAQKVGGAYAPVLDEPVPLALTLAASAANEGRRGWSLPTWAGLAASLVVGVLLGRSFLAPEQNLAQTPAGLAARGPLAHSLSTALASEAGPIRVGLTFRDHGGRYCRTFQSSPDRLAGLACHDRDGWALQAAAAWSPNGGPAYRTAGSDTPPAILAAVEQLRAGDPLDAAQERAAREAGWARATARPAP